MSDNNDGQLDRDSAYRIAALQAAVTRSRHERDGKKALEYATIYYQWLGGTPDDGDPVAEKKTK